MRKYLGLIFSLLFIQSPLVKAEDSHKNHSTMETKAAAKKGQYYCPMHPQIISDKPGNCPICGMDLVQQKDEGGEEEHSQHSDLMPQGHANVNLSVERQQLIGVQIEKVKKTPLFKTITAPGRVAFDPELYTAQGELQQALLQMERIKDSPLQDVKRNTSKMVESAKIRLRVLGLSENQIRQIKPYSPLPSNLLVQSKGQTPWIYAEVYEMDLHHLREGLSAQITGISLEGEKVPGKVISIDRVINPKTRTAKVRIQLEKIPQTLRPESYVDVTIFAPQGEHIAVPLNAILDTGKEAIVFVQTKPGVFEPRNVIIKLKAGDFAAIGSGIKEGEEYVVSGNFLIDSESRIRGALMQGQSSGGHQH